MSLRLSAVPLLLLALSVAGCDVNIQSCSGKQVCISKGGEQIVGSGTIRSETRDVGSFTAVRFEDAGRVVIEGGETDSVTVSSDDNVLPKITTEVRRGVLVIGTADHTQIAANELVYKITVRNLQAIDATGSGMIEASKVTSNRLMVSVAGSSNLRLSGKTGDLKLLISGSGAVNATGLPADRADVIVNGSGNASLNVRESLSAVISGSGNVTYTGTPKVLSNISGSGSLRSKLAS